MSLPRYQGILERLQDLQRARLEAPDSPFLLDDADDLVEELLVQAARQVVFPTLSDRLSARQKLDFDALRAAAIFFRSLKLPEFIVLTPALTVHPEKELKDLESDIQKIEALLKNDPTATASIALDFRLGGQLLRLTMCAIKEGRPLEALVGLVREKLGLPHANQIVYLWSLLQREFDQDLLTKFAFVDGIVTRDFLVFENDSRARDKLAHYIAELKPRLMLALYGRNGAGYPIELNNVASVLSWTSSDTVLSFTEIRLAKSVSRIVWGASRLFARSREELASALGIDAKSPLLKEPDNARTNNKQPSLSDVLYEVGKAAKLLTELSVAESDFAVCLRRYKLGLEVMAPEIRKELSSKNELILQKEIARFAVERGFYVVGTRFGRSETDLVSWEKEALYIVETKLYTGTRPVGASDVRGAFAQLSSYMDQHPETPRGVLIIYNLTPVQISAPPNWIHERFLVLPINLQPQSPSQRTQLLEISEGDEERLINVHSVSPPTGTRQQQQKRKASRRTKTTRRR